jgi:hypothetical protein
MIDPDSRYSAAQTAVHECADGTPVLYLRRRFLPDPDDVPSARSVDSIDRRERLDLIAATQLGDAFSFWRICDANDALNPFDLIAESGGVLRVPSGLTIR